MAPTAFSVGRSTAGVFVAHGLNLVLSVGNSIFLARALGVTGKGEFALFSASVSLLTLLLSLGLDNALRYFVARDQVDGDRLLTSLLLFVAGAGAAVFLLARLNHFAFSNEVFLPRHSQGPLFELVLAGTVAATLLHANVSSVFAGNRAFRTLNVMSVGLAGVSFLVYGSLFLLDRTGHFAVGSREIFATYLVLSWVNAGTLTVLAYSQLGVRPSLRLLDVELLGGMFRYGLLAYGAGIAQFLNYRLDYWLVQTLTGAAALGLYSLAANLAMMFWMLPRSAQTVLMPAIAAGESGTTFEDNARQTRILLWLIALLALPVGVLAGWWIPLLYGGEFSASAPAFALLLLGCIPFTVAILLAAAHAAHDRVDINLKASGIGLVLTVVLDLLLIPRWGIRGAAVASSLSYLATTLYVVREFSRLGGVPYRAILVPTWADWAYLRDGLGSLRSGGGRA